MAQLMAIVQADPAVNNVVGFTGGGSGGGRSSTNTGSVFVSLKPLSQRTASADQVINGLRRKLGAIAGAHLFLQSVQDIRSAAARATRNSNTHCRARRRRS